jgi:hypothetical protein
MLQELMSAHPPLTYDQMVARNRAVTAGVK